MASKTRPRLKEKARETSRRKSSTELNLRQQNFVTAYAANGGNATEATIAAGYSVKGASVAGHRLLRNVRIAKALQAQARRRLTRADITAEKVLVALADIGFSDSEPEKPKPSERIAALTTLAKHLGLLVERHEVDSRQSILNVNVSAADLESARQLVESTLKRPQIEGKVEPGEDEEK